MDHKVLFVPGDLGACGYYRITQRFQLLQMNPAGIQPIYLGPMVLQNAGQQVTVTQRIVSAQALRSLIQFKQNFGSKVIIDYDDLLWTAPGEKLHKYNMFLNMIDLNKAYTALKEYLPDAADAVTVSSQSLKDSLKEIYPEDRIYVLPNMLAIREWGFDRAVAVPSDDTFFYTGSLSHYSNAEEMYGDFSIPMANYLRKAPTMYMGDEKPWFFEKCFQETKWVSIELYPNFLYQNTRKAKFTMAPLDSNKFNACKSDLKYLESCALGRVCLVSDFENSPYSGAHELQKIPVDASLDDIKNAVARCNEHYAEILEYQYQYLNRRWMDTNMARYVSSILSVI